MAFLSLSKASFAFILEPIRRWYGKTDLTFVSLKLCTYHNIIFPSHKFMKQSEHKCILGPTCLPSDTDNTVVIIVLIISRFILNRFTCSPSWTCRKFVLLKFFFNFLDQSYANYVYISNKYIFTDSVIILN